MTKFSWNRHQTIHSNYKPFMCRNCGKKFGLAQSLREHSYIHTKQRPYTCGVDECKKAFRHPSELSLHRRTHPEYKLRKYRYITRKGINSIDMKTLNKLVPMVSFKEGNPISKKKEEDNGSEYLSQTSAKTRLNEVRKEDSVVDMKFLEYLKNITKFQERRPLLPFPARDVCGTDKNFLLNP